MQPADIWFKHYLNQLAEIRSTVCKRATVILLNNALERYVVGLKQKEVGLHQCWIFEQFEFWKVGDCWHILENGKNIYNSSIGDLK